jgi:hypothetical protein
MPYSPISLPNPHSETKGGLNVLDLNYRSETLLTGFESTQLKSVKVLKNIRNLDIYLSRGLELCQLRRMDDCLKSIKDSLT